MKQAEQIAILMATYNGGPWLHEQLDSLVSQTFTDWHLYVHDDGSTDQTPGMLEDYSRQHPGRLTILTYPPQGGACRNFLSMLEAIEAPYYMFCDQDDVWMKDKIEKTFQRMQQLEAAHADCPIIVHTDLMLVDAALQPLASSFIRHQLIKIEAIHTFSDYAATNTVTGCTMLLNKRARQCLKKPYDKAIMHDAWLCLSVVAQGGIVDFIDEPTILYRQHGDNTLGARDMERQTTLHKLMNIRRQIADDIRHYREMNAIRPLTVIDFLKAKIHYRNY